jgi:hypothetical protein
LLWPVLGSLVPPLARATVTPLSRVAVTPLAPALPVGLPREPLPALLFEASARI